MVYDIKTKMLMVPGVMEFAKGFGANNVWAIKSNLNTMKEDVEDKFAVL
jgi:hypothetical protein